MELLNIKSNKMYPKMPNPPRQTKKKRITVSKKDCDCSDCGEQINKGEAIQINPTTGEVKCSKCFKNK